MYIGVSLLTGICLSRVHRVAGGRCIYSASSPSGRLVSVKVSACHLCTDLSPLVYTYTRVPAFASDLLVTLLSSIFHPSIRLSIDHLSVCPIFLLTYLPAAWFTSAHISSSLLGAMCGGHFCLSHWGRGGCGWRGDGAQRWHPVGCPRRRVAGCHGWVQDRAGRLLPAASGSEREPPGPAWRMG